MGFLTLMLISVGKAVAMSIALNLGRVVNDNKE
ncbi:Uncharacterised protein [Chlamydia trachomatis]|nr:Uncharacterised protein [Chlamydia trachomatis]